MLRLRREHDIHRTFQEGQRFYSPSAVLHARRRDPQEQLPRLPRLAVIAGRRFRTAVARNRARRLLREACRWALADVRGSWDLVFLARPKVLVLPFPARLEAVSALLRRADVLTEKAAAGL